MWLSPVFEFGPICLRFAFSTEGWLRAVEHGWGTFARPRDADLTVEVEVDRSLPPVVRSLRSPAVHRSRSHLEVEAEDFVLKVDQSTRRAWLRMADAAEPLLNAVRYLVAARLEGKGVLLHASAAYGSRGALAFFGDSGRGKSTLAALASSRCGRLADDTLLLTRERPGRWRAFSTPLSMGTPGAHRLIALWGLRRGSGAQLHALRPADAIRELMSNVVIAGDQPEALAPIFSMLGQLVREVELAVLRFSPGPEAVEQVSQALGGSARSGRAA